MLVDINASIGQWPFQQLQYNTLPGMLERMNRFGVDKAVVANLNGIFYKNTQSANEELFAAWQSVPSFQERFVPFAVINPTYAGWKDDLETSHHQFGMKGVRLYPKYHDYGITDPNCIALVKQARDLGMVIALTLRMVDFRQRSWMDIDKEWGLKDVLPLIREVPDARYMILNIANGPVVNEADAALIRKADVLMDTSGRALWNLPDLISRYGENKFAFGTHAPVQDYLTGLLRIESLRDAEVSKEIRARLRAGNAMAMLQLDH